MNPWQLSHRADPLTCRIADRHYNRQKIGSPQCAPSGRAIVLRVGHDQAFWITSWPEPEYVKHRWPGAWTCTAFRREPWCPQRASDLIRQAVASTIWVAKRTPSWERAQVSTLGVLTFVDETKVEEKALPGWCYVRAGFRYLKDESQPDGRARTKDRNLLVLWLPRRRWPAPLPPAQWARSETAA